MTEYHAVIIIGGGPAGLAAAVALHDKGVRGILILERERHLGGILRQCIHDGFGLTRFGEALSGPEYAERFIDAVTSRGIKCITETTIIELTGDKVVTAVSRSGLCTYQASAVVLAMGCRERTRGAIAIPGDRPAGVFNAGVAQAYINLYNTMPGKKAVILGSGDIGMIMARRLTLEGAKVLAVLEVLPHASGLPRNVEQCLNDYEIPLYCRHTVTGIHGKSRLTGVTASRVDEALQPIPGTETEYECDTLILSVGLIPENELSRMAGVEIDPHTGGAVVDEHFQTSVPGIFAAGNVLHVHDLVDFVSLEAERLAASAAEFVHNGRLPCCPVNIIPGQGIGHVIPQRISGDYDAVIAFRVRNPLRDCIVSLMRDEKIIVSRRYKKALPAEMLHITFPEGLDNNGDITVVAVAQ